MVLFTYSLSILCVFLLIILFINIYNISSQKKLHNLRIGDNFPKLSVIIPARNEEDNIERCVLSILKQDYDDLEVIIVDDNSTDNTYNIITGIAKKYKNRLKIVKNKKLPEQWMGKNWACHNGYLASNGEVLLFLDADTYFIDDKALKKSVTELTDNNIGLLNCIPYQKTVTISEKAILPIIFWIINTGFSHSVNKKTPHFAFAIGMFMMFSRQSYEAIGGHKEVKSCVIEDIELSKNIVRKGLKSAVMNGVNSITCRMYNNITEIINGFTKQFYTIFKDINPILLVFLIITAISFSFYFFYYPIFCLIAHFFNITTLTPFVLIMSIVNIGILLTSMLIVYIKYRFPVLMIIGYPIYWLFVLFLLPINTFIKGISHKVSWKDRIIP